MLADILEALEGELAVAGVPLRDGPEHLVERSAPCIVAVPMDDGYGEPEYYDADAPEAVAQVNAGVDFHVLGKKRKDTEILNARLLGALRAVVARSYTVGPGYWENQNAEALVKYGRPYVLRVTFQMPVVPPTSEAVTEATIGATDTGDAALEGPP
jgi:hypothetical protein